MAGYSGTPLPKKLGIKADHCVALVNAPPGFASSLGELPAGVGLDDQPGEGRYDVILLFVRSRDHLGKRFRLWAKRLTPAGGLWVAWPKKASGVETDLTENVVREIGLETGLVDNKVCVVDEVWSGLRFVIRLVDRPKAPKTRVKGA